MFLLRVGEKIHIIPTKNFCSGTFKESPIPYLLYLKNNRSRNETVKQSNIYTIKYKNQFRTKVQIRKVGWE
jgi:hypothetical protein